MRAFVFIVFFGLAAALATPAAAQVVSRSCDPDFMDVMEARAWLEGKREIEFAQTLLLKPDSVLDYSCFRRRVNQLGDAADDLFSDNVDSTDLFKTQYFTARDIYEPSILPGNPAYHICIANRTCFTNFGPDPPGGMSANTFDRILRLLVLEALTVYQNQNFDHTMGGGRTGVNRGPCNIMNQVWQSLKCENFDRPGEDRWLTFDELIGTDPRVLPQPCQEAGRQGMWAAAIAAAFPAPALPAANGGMDAERSYLELLDPGNCAHPIPTGLIVETTGESFLDKVCSSPGCWYDHRANFCRR